MGVSTAAAEIQSEGVGGFVQGLCLPAAAESPVWCLLADMFPLPARLSHLLGHRKGMAVFRISNDHTQFLVFRTIVV